MWMVNIASPLSYQGDNRHLNVIFYLEKSQTRISPSESPMMKQLPQETAEVVGKTFPALLVQSFMRISLLIMQEWSVVLHYQRRIYPSQQQVRMNSISWRGWQTSETEYTAAVWIHSPRISSQLSSSSINSPVSSGILHILTSPQDPAVTMILSFGVESILQMIPRCPLRVITCSPLSRLNTFINVFFFDEQAAYRQFPMNFKRQQPRNSDQNLQTSCLGTSLISLLRQNFSNYWLSLPFTSCQGWISSPQNLYKYFLSYRYSQNKFDGALAQSTNLYFGLGQQFS